MPIPTPFHSRTAPLCDSHEWRNWSGYLAASLYEPGHEREYYAIRNAAALIDVSPLFKYEIHGPDALEGVNRIVTRDARQCLAGRVMYTPWCDDDGKVIDDGTLWGLSQDSFRLTAAEPNLAWFQDCCYGLDVQVDDVSDELAALAVQGPSSRKMLEAALGGVDLSSLKYYHHAQWTLHGLPVDISRTGYTGDLGYELWVKPAHAEKLWDVLWQVGVDYGMMPAGILALDIARIEAGLIMQQVDYISARKAVIPAQKSSPFELGMGWAVNLEKGDFVGRKALLAEKEGGSKWKFVGLQVNWDSLEALYDRLGLTPMLVGRASREAAPVYHDERHVGQMTSHTFSPLLKSYIAIGTIEEPYARLGNKVRLEFTVEYIRQSAQASVVQLPFYNPPRKRA